MSSSNRAATGSGSSEAAAGSGSSRAAAGIFLSRVLGLVREILIGATLGITPAAEAFRLAMKIPNVVQNLLGEGSLSASFVPVYAKLLEDDDHASARRLANGVLGLLIATITIIVALIVIFASPIVAVLGAGLPDPATREKAVELVRITAVGVGLLGVSAWCLGVLNSHRQYFLSYAAPSLWNLAQIATLAVAAVSFKLQNTSGFSVAGLGALAAENAATAATWLAVAALVGSVLQLGIQLPKVQYLSGGVSPRIGGPIAADSNLGIVIRRFWPALWARGVVQVASLADTFLATWLVAGGLATFALVAPLYILPISLFGFSVATTELTEMSRQSDRLNVVAGRLRMGLRKVVLPAGLAVSLLFFGGGALADSLYRWPNRLVSSGGGISADNATVFGLTMAVYALALPAAMTARVTQNALFALGNTKAPARIALIRLGVLLSVTVLVMFQFDRLSISNSHIIGWSDLPHWPPWEPLDQSVRVNPQNQAHLGVVGLAVGSLAASWTEWALLRAKLASLLGERVSSGLALPVIAASLASGVIVLAVRVLGGLPMPIEGIIVCLLALASYIGILWFLGVRPRPQPQA